MKIILHLFCLLVAARKFTNVRGREVRPDNMEISDRYCHLIYTLGLTPLDGKRKFPRGRADWEYSLKVDDEIKFSMYKHPAQDQWIKGRIMVINYDLECAAVYSLDGGMMPVIIPISQIRKERDPNEFFTK